MWTVKYADLPARLKANRGTEKVGVENLEKYIRGEFTLYLEAGVEITEKMRAEVYGKDYEITFVSAVRDKDSIHHLELQLKSTS